MSDFTPKKQAKALLLQIHKKEKELARLHKRLDKIQSPCQHLNGTTTQVPGEPAGLFFCPDCLYTQKEYGDFG